MKFALTIVILLYMGSCNNGIDSGIIHGIAHEYEVIEKFNNFYLKEQYDSLLTNFQFEGNPQNIIDSMKFYRDSLGIFVSKGKTNNTSQSTADGKQSMVQQTTEREYKKGRTVETLSLKINDGKVTIQGFSVRLREN